MAKVTGLGGIFYVARDPEGTRAWYRDVLGVDGPYGPQLAWSLETNPAPYSLISPMKNAAYLQPSQRDFMINLRVDDVDEMVDQLQAKGIAILGHTDEGYGKFAWVKDPEGVKIELWQQVAAPE